MPKQYALYNYFIPCLLLAVVGFWAALNDAKKVDHLKYSNDIFFTLVYGGEDAKLNHSDAEAYCVNIGTTLNVTGSITVKSHLVSMHDPIIIRTLMDWVLTKEHRQFYIGGIITKVVHQERQQFIIRWTDDAPDDFRSLHSPATVLQDMEPFESRCLAVDYLNGRWGVHKCARKMYFMCETRIIDPEAMLKEYPERHTFHA